MAPFFFLLQQESQMPVNPTEQTKLTSKLCNANWVAADIQRVFDLLPPKHAHSEHWVEIYSTL